MKNIHLSILVAIAGWATLQVNAAETKKLTDTLQNDTTFIAETVPVQNVNDTSAKQATAMDDIVEGTKRIVDGSVKIAKSVANEFKRSTTDSDDIQDSIDDAREEAEEREEEAQERRDESEERHFDLGASVHKSRKQGYGGGIGYAPAVMLVSMRPIYQLAQTDPMVNVRTFPNLDDGYRAVMGSGILGYGGVGNGVRIGGGGWNGDWREGSEKYGGPEGDDSIAVLQMHFKYGGFLVEKAFVHDRFNTVVGGMLAFGSIETKLLKTSATSAFLSVADSDKEDAVTAKAQFAGLELHGGFTYSFLPWMHIGADIQGLLAGSMKGFDGPGNSPFVVAYPGLRLRLMLGNLG